MSECQPMDEIFTHIDEVTGRVRHINASLLTRAMPIALRSGIARRVTAVMDHEFVAFIKEHRGVEQWKLDRLVEPFLSLPVTGVTMEDDCVLTVDGHHRLVRWEERGDETYEMVVYGPRVWETFCVVDFPEDFSAYIAEQTEQQVEVGPVLVYPSKH